MTEKGSPAGFSWLVEGKLAGMSMPYDPEEAVELLKDLGVRAVVSLTGKPLASKALDKNGIDHLHVPIGNFEAPTQEQIGEFLDFCDRHHNDGGAVVVHCLAGMGRTGTMLACYLVREGTPAGKAIRQVREKRPGSIETASQERAVYVFEESLNRPPAGNHER